MTKEEFKAWLESALGCIVDMQFRSGDEDTLEGWTEEFTDLLRYQANEESEP